jgi:DNA (cytosine-5)-methyltransferase 1
VSPGLVDLFCCEGGAGQGYATAGFRVLGVDIVPRPRFPFTFVQADALEWLRFMMVRPDAIHASPPCQDRSVSMQFGRSARGTAHLLTETIQLLRKRDIPWVVENVESRINKQDMSPAPGEHLFRLCGSSFGLGAHDSRGQWRILTRHRLFLANFPVTAPPCKHGRGDLVGGVYGNGEQGVNGGRGYGFAADVARTALRVPWMSRDGAKECIPPAYTEFIGRQLFTQVTSLRMNHSGQS